MVKKKYIVSILTGTAIALGATLGATAATAVSAESEAPENVSITCESTGNNPVVIITEADSGNQGTMLTFKTEYFSSIEEAQESCEHAATTLQSNYEQGIQDKYLNGLDTKETFDFCLTGRRGDTCESRDAQQLFSVEKRDGDYLDLVYADFTGQEASEDKDKARGVVRLYSDLESPWWWPIRR